MTRSPFPLIPVLDLKGGHAVHAVAGRRAYYQPVQSILHPSSDPLELARALFDVLGLSVLYLADLDAIAGGVPDVARFEKLISMGFQLVVDAGMRDRASVARLRLLDRRSTTLVAGLETLEGPCALEAILDELGAERTIFSLDLFEGRARIASSAAWKSGEPRELACEAIERGVGHILLLDLARVGTGRGPATQILLAQIRADHPGVRVSVGGGIARIEDVIELKNAGAWSVLVASAIHDGRIGTAELACLDAAAPGGLAR